VHNSVKTGVSLEQSRHRIGVAQVAFLKSSLGMYRCPVPLRQIIEHDDLVAGADQLGDGDAAAVARATTYNNFHKLSLY
jgi:hypothetical protein